MKRLGKQKLLKSTLQKVMNNCIPYHVDDLTLVTMMSSLQLKVVGFQPTVFPNSQPITVGRCRFSGAELLVQGFYRLSLLSSKSRTRPFPRPKSAMVLDLTDILDLHMGRCQSHC